MALGHHNSEGAERGRRAQDGAHIVRVGHLIEDDEDGVGRGGPLAQHLLERRLLERGDLERDPLMHRRRQQTVELATAHHLGGEAGLAGSEGAKLARERAPGLGGQEQALAASLRIGQGREHGVSAEEPMAGAALGGPALARGGCRKGRRPRARASRERCRDRRAPCGSRLAPGATVGLAFGHDIPLYCTQSRSVVGPPIPVSARRDVRSPTCALTLTFEDEST